MLPILIGIGLSILIYGVYSVHLVGKTHGKILRFSSVLLAMIGATLLWLLAAFYSPVITNQKSETVISNTEWLIIEVHYNKIRDCNLEKFNVIFLKGDTKAKLLSHYISSDSPASSIESASILLRNITEMEPDSFYVESVHRCPFNIQISSTFPKQRLSDSRVVPEPKFNGPRDTSAFMYILTK